MTFWLVPAMEIPVVTALLLAQARQELLPRAMQRVALRPVAENRPAQATRERRGPAVPV
jgi:hypothetical protein